jgi:hypothetical protein
MCAPTAQSVHNSYGFPRSVSLASVCMSTVRACLTCTSPPQGQKKAPTHTVHAHPERKDLEQQAAEGLKAQIPAAGGTKPEVSKVNNSGLVQSSDRGCQQPGRVVWLWSWGPECSDPCIWWHKA